MLMMYTKTDFSNPREYRKRYMELVTEGSLSLDEVDGHIKELVGQFSLGMLIK